MSVFIVHQNPAVADDKGLVFLKDRFSWLAFLLPPLWALSRGLWLPLIAMFAAVAALAIVSTVFLLPIFWLYLFACWWLGLAASSIEGFFLGRRGWSEKLHIVAPDIYAAEQQFFYKYSKTPFEENIKNEITQ